MEENMAKFSERLQELLAIAKKKKNVLEYQEINDFFRDLELDADHFDKILEAATTPLWRCWRVPHRP